MKTAQQWLMQLKDHHRALAFANLRSSRSTWECDSLLQAVDYVSWGSDSDGYWQALYDLIECGEYFDAPQQTEETCKADAKKTMYGLPKERMATAEDMQEMEELIDAAPPTEPNFGTLPTDPAERKEIPVYSGCVNYFPLALAAVARLSKKGNDQHNPGTPLHWDRSKSGDELDAMMRHIIDGDWDAVAWRALAHLQKIEENK